MNNGNKLVWIGFLVLAALGGWIVMGVLDDSSGRHTGPLDIGSAAGDREEPTDPAAADSVVPTRQIETVGAPVTVRSTAGGTATVALKAFEEDAEARPLVGIVRDREGEPVVGARVAVRLHGYSSGGRMTAGAVVGSTLTDEQGMYSLEGFARLGERYVLDVTHPEFARHRVDVVDPLAPATMTQDIVMWEGVNVSGVVTSAAGQPLGGVDVVVYDLELRAIIPDGVEEGSTRTDEEGRYDIGRLCTGMKRVVARTPGFASSQRSPLRLSDSLDAVDFTLSAGHHIAGHVLDADTGEGIANVTVRAAAVTHSTTRHAPGSNARLRPPPGNVGESVKTGPDGSFRIDGLAKGYHLISIVDGPGKGATTNASVGDEKVVLKARLRGVVSGVVIDADTGSPIPRFSVALARGERAAMVPSASFQRVADDNGAFEIMDVAPGKHHVVVTAPGYGRGSSMPIETGLGERVSGIQVRLRRGLVVHGRVVDVSGDPIGGASVAIVEEVQLPASRTHPSVLPQRRVDAGRRSARSFADGSFLMPNLSKGRYHLMVDHPEFERVETRSFDLYGTEGILELSDVVLALGATVTGTVIGEDGRPDHLAVVSAISVDRPKGRYVVPPASTDGEGKFSFRGLGAGRWKFVVTQRAGRVQLDGRASSDTQVLELTAGDRRRIEFKR